jgi:hypothetical protein
VGAPPRGYDLWREPVEAGASRESNRPVPRVDPSCRAGRDGSAEQGGRAAGHHRSRQAREPAPTPPHPGVQGCPLRRARVTAPSSSTPSSPDHHATARPRPPPPPC